LQQSDAPQNVFDLGMTRKSLKSVIQIMLYRNSSGDSKPRLRRPRVNDSIPLGNFVIEPLSK